MRLQSVDNNNTHAAAGAGNLAHRGLDGGGGEVGHFLLSDLAKLCGGDGADLILVGNAGALVLTDGLEDEGGGRRSLGYEGEAAVGIDRDDDRDLEAGLILRALIELFDELCDIDAVLAECRADRGRRGSLRSK